MPELDTNPNIARADDLYQQLIEAHSGLSDAESMALLAKLVLVLANHIGDPAIIAQALALATGAPRSEDHPD
jgi:hypothetical protein